MLDFGCVISKTMFENVELVERGLGLDAGTLSWRGPFDLDSDPLWRDMLAGRLTERQYWATRAAEVGALLGKQWDTRAFYDKACDICGLAWFRSEFLDLLDDARRAGIRRGILSNELELFHSPGWVESVPALKKIDAIVDATHTKILKPDPRAYQLGLEALQAAPEQTLFVDDQNSQRARRGGGRYSVPAFRRKTADRDDAGNPQASGAADHGLKASTSIAQRRWRRVRRRPCPRAVPDQQR